MTDIEKQAHRKLVKQAWYKRHSEESKARAKEWHKNNIDKARKASRDWYYRNKETVAEKAKTSRKNCPQKHRGYYLKFEHNLSLEEYDRMYAEQKGKCKLCLKKKSLVVDHDHGTGRKRGLLCDLCNRGIGYLKENIPTLKRAIEYLR